MTEDIAFNGLVYAFFVFPSFLLVWVLLRTRLMHWRIQPQQRAKLYNFLHDAGYSALTLVVFGLIDYAIFLLEKRGYTQVYYDINQYGVSWFILSVVLMMLIHDAYFYWTHRAMHHPWLYRYFHRVHHESTDPSPFTSYAFHPLEAIVENGIAFILVFIMPVNFYALIVWQLLQQFFNMIGHLGYEVYPAWWIKTPVLQWKTPSTHHNMHHELFNGNYGLYFTWWDKWCGTEFKQYERRYAQIFERKEQNQNTSAWHDLTVSAIRSEPNDAVSLYFDKVPMAFQDFEAGQHITLKINLHNETLYRTFSISSVPRTDKGIRLTIKKIAQGKVTPYLTEKIKVGDTLSASAPAGKFYVKPYPEQQKHYLMIAGGSGITPIYSMIGTILPVETNSKITLLYANRSQDSIIFKEALAKWQSAYKNGFEVLHFVNQYITAEDLKKVCAGVPLASVEVYLCAPEKMLEAMQTYLQTLPIPENRIHQEVFVPFSTAKSHQKATIHVSLAGKFYTFTNDEHQTILESALAKQVPIAHACKSGMCGTCKMTCTAGKITMQNNQILTEQEIKQGYVLACQAIPETANISLTKS